MKLKLKPRNVHKIIVATAGGFDPIHIGHIRLIKEARKLGDQLIVILNNDNWLRKKKEYVFMPEKERKEILMAIEEVDEVTITKHRPNDPDTSVMRELKRIQPHIFARGGDTSSNAPNGDKEIALCKQLGTRMVFGIGHGGKVQSSSKLVVEARKKSSLTK